MSSRCKLKTQKRKNVRKLDDDRITELPKDVMERILVCLPLQDAVKTSLLSREWRYKWVTIPHITIDDEYIEDSNSKLINFIDRLLLLHIGPIEKFELITSRICIKRYHINRWILFLSRNGIKEFILCYNGGCPIKVPSCLFSCKQLNYLELHLCILKSPPTFDGFHNLRSLNLQFITFIGCTFEVLISSCPLLERLTLVHTDGSTDFKIHAPNLKYLDFIGLFKSLCIQNAQFLATGSINLEWDEDIWNGQPSEGKTSNMVQVFGCCTVIEKLDVQNDFLKFLGVGNVPNRLPNAFNNLKKLEIHLIFMDLDEFAAALCLIKSSPNLQSLKIWANHGDKEAEMDPVIEFLEKQDPLECSLNQLLQVNILYITGVRTEMEFIKFLLENTPALEMMTILLNHRMDVEVGPRTMKEILQYRRASPKAVIKLLLTKFRYGNACVGCRGWTAIEYI